MAAAVRRRVRVERRPEGVKAVGGPGSPGGERADSAGSVIAAESAREGACWATAVAVAGLLQSPCYPHIARQNNEAKAVSSAGKNVPRPERRSTVVMVADTRAMDLPEGTERSSILICSPCARKSRKSEETKGSPPKTAFSARVTSSPKPVPGVGEERVRSPQVRMRKRPSSSTGVRLLDPLRSHSVASSGKRDRKSAFPLALPLRYSRVSSNAVRNSSHRWTRALWSPTLQMV